MTTRTIDPQTLVTAIGALPEPHRSGVSQYAVKGASLALTATTLTHARHVVQRATDTIGDALRVLGETGADWPPIYVEVTCTATADGLPEIRDVEVDWRDGEMLWEELGTPGRGRAEWPAGARSGPAPTHHRAEEA